MRVRVQELQIDGDIGALYPDPQPIRCHILWRVDTPNIEQVFWTRNLDWMPDLNAIYEYTPPPKRPQGTFKLLS